MSNPKLNNSNLSNISEQTKIEAIKSSPETFDEQSYLGTDPDPELATENDTLEEAQDMGLYQNADEEHPVPVGESNDLI